MTAKQQIHVITRAEGLSSFTTLTEPKKKNPNYSNARETRRF